MRCGSKYVCDDNFTHLEAKMVCASLGSEMTWFETRQVNPEGSSSFGIDNLDCPEGATNMGDCSYDTEHDCYQDEAVRMGCSGDGSIAPSYSPSDSDDGWTWTTSEDDGSDGMSGAAMAGILFAILLVLCCISVCAYLLCAGAAASICLIPFVCCAKGKDNEKGVVVKERSMAEELDETV